MIRLALTGLVAGVLLGVPSGSATSVEADRQAPNQTFVLIGDGSGPDAVAASGVLHAKGTDKILSDTKDKFKFADGTLVIKHKPKAGTAQESYDPVTCHFSFSERGTWKVVKGTGAYANAAGSGTYKAEGQGIGCDEGGSDLTFYSAVKAKGNLSY